MKGKKEYVILIAVIVALCLYLVLRNPDRAQYDLPKLPGVDASELTKLEVFKEETSMMLKKDGDVWRIEPEGYAADTEKVKRMTEAIEALTLDALVSESQSYGRYDLGNDKKITVRAWTGDKVAREFDLGKAASSFQHTFVKLADDDRVFHGRGNFRAKFDQTVDDLRDKTVLSFDRSEIAEIRVTQEKQEVAFIRTEVPVEVKASEAEGEGEGPPPTEVETIWQTADGKRGDENQLKRLLVTLSSLRCEAYIDEKQKDDYKNPKYTVRLRGTQEYTLSVFAKTDEDAKNYPAISSETEHPFMLPEWQVNNLMKEPEELLEESGRKEKTS